MTIGPNRPTIPWAFSQWMVQHKQKEKGRHLVWFYKIRGEATKLQNRDNSTIFAKQETLWGYSYLSNGADNI